MGDLMLKQRLARLIQKKVSFEVSQDKLLVKGDLAVLNEEDKQFLKENKQEIISLIENASSEISLVKNTNKENRIPLSFSQQSLWLLDRINNGSSHYNLTSAFKLKGRLDYNALNKAFTSIIERHDTLRSTFFVDNSGEPFQKIQKVERFTIVAEEFDTADSTIESQLFEKIEEETNKIFDLTQDLLVNVRLFKVNANEHFLIVTMHHIASDGWSIGIFVNEISILYNSYLEEKTNALPELTVQYSDYAIWQRKRLQGKILEKQIDYWKNLLADLPVIHNLPLDNPRPFVQTFNGSTYYSKVEAKTLKSLYSLCKTESATLFMAIHAVFSVLLARYSNAKDIVVGTPIANREKAEIAGLVGFFMNLIVLRSDLSQNPSFIDLLRQSKKMLEESYDYQELPFEKLVEELKVKRNLGHSPLFQVLLSLQNNEQEQVALTDLTLETVTYKNTRSAKYDLSLNIIEISGELSLSWEYNTDLFNEETIARMAGHFDTLLNSVLVNPDENVFKINMISDKDAEDICKHLDGEVLNLTDVEETNSLFEYQLKNNPDKTAVICGGVSYTYKALGEKVDSIASHLVQNGVQNSDRVGICLLRSIEMVASIFACFKIGAAYIPLDPVYSSIRLNQIVKDAEPKCIITHSALRELYLKEMYEDFIYLDKLDLTVNDKVVINCHDENTAYIIFTSGTTGKPKGIEVSHANLKNFLKALDISFGTQTRQNWLAQTSMNFDISVLELIWTISRGHQIVLQQSNPFKLLSSDNISQTKNLDFSIMFFGADKENDAQKYNLILETAKYADKNDFTAIWTPERHFGEFGGLFPSPAVLGSAISVLTEKIKVRSGSVVLPLHDPIRVAEEWAVIDNLSNGRTGISIASGWHPNDFVFSNSNYEVRHIEMREKITELKKLWEGHSVIRKNGTGQDFEITIRPEPIQKQLPLWITAAGNPETFKYAGEIGANVLTHMLGQSLEKLAENIAVYHKALKENGFTVEDKTVSLMLHTYIDADQEKAAEISEKPFKEYLRSSIKLMEPLAQELSLNIDTQSDEIIEFAYRKFSKENTLIGSVQSCQKMLQSIQNIGVTEVACLVDFGVENEKVLSGLKNIAKAKSLYQKQNELRDLLNINNQKNELELIDTYKVTHVQMTPSQSKLILDLYNQDNSRDISSVEHWMIGGEPLNQNLIDGLSEITNAKLYNMYGPTETTVWSAWREIRNGNFKIGNPILNTKLLLLNEFEQQVPLGVVGELYIGGSGVSKGYYNNSELTAGSFKKLKNKQADTIKFYKTGDLMRLNPDGTFDYEGRKDNQVKINGYRIEPEEIENVICKIPEVKDCKVVPITDSNTTYLSAYIVKEEIVFGNYKELPVQEQAKAFKFPDGSTVYHQSNRQLAMLYKEIFEDEIYFKHNISIPENAVVIDAGANIGSFSMHVNQKQPSAFLVAFEPIPQIFSGLKQNFEHRNIKGRILNYGVSNKKENATFYYYPEMAGMSGRFTEKETIVDAVGGYVKHDKTVLSQNANHSNEDVIVKSFYESIDSEGEMNDEFKNYLNSLYEAKEVDCQLTTISDVIDDLKLECIDLLKVDVEKSECLVLEGVREEHWSKIHQLAIEVDGDYNLDSIVKLLKKNGYKIQIDELAMSDSDTIKNENTYMLYAINDDRKKTHNSIERQYSAPQVNESFVRNYLKNMLPDYMNPKDIAFVSSIPLMENGKVNLIKLKELKPKKAVQENTVKLNNQVEQDIYSLWCEVLKKESIPYEVSIFEAGGNSIEIVLLHEKLQTKFNISFSLVELFRNPTIQQQAKLIQNSNPIETNSSQKVLDKGTLRRNARTSRIN
ncbi:MupA/Atu3671 family FMN-dependent luciferase-like monooxygenase [Flavobacterium sp. H4147]|uniref:MupA/Atu3671 family FMN-dependent luciferase-like monooxygenase n=1 Tax=Flavobacterium sp. H4147 TaxID=3034149 RepID=UPI0023ECE3A4|nr:MupA/Atu3671 family FMN-dependent luciferase-like monooxygenase [Flavobacterium sp. H4147]